MPNRKPFVLKCECGRQRSVGQPTCLRCRRLAAQAKEIRTFPACQMCGGRIQGERSKSDGRCFKCRVPYQRQYLVGLPTPAHIEARIDLYAARVAAGVRGEALFAGFERDAMVERGMRDVA